MGLTLTKPEVKVFARHSDNCTHCDVDRDPECKCRKWLYVSGTREKIPLKTRSWGTADAAAKAYVQKHDPNSIPDIEFIPKKVEDAFKDLILSKTIEKKNAKTIANYQTVLDQLTDYIDEQNSKRSGPNKITFAHECTSEFLKGWMAKWSEDYGCVEDASLNKKRKYLNAFFSHFLRSRWIKFNPVDALPKFKAQSATVARWPFENDELDRVLAATLQIEVQRHPNTPPELPRLFHALCNFMAQTGLSILDATIFERSRLTKDGDGYYIDLYRAKTGNAVRLLVRDELAEELLALPFIGNGKYFFWDGKGQAEGKSAANLWAKRLLALFRALDPAITRAAGKNKIATPSSHWFRNTFIKDMLVAGVSVDDVADMVGDTPAVIRKYYKKWIPALQARLDGILRAIYAKQNGATGTCPTCGQPVATDAPKKTPLAFPSSVPYARA